MIPNAFANGLTFNLKSDFIRIHRAYMINLQHVDEIEGNILFMSNGERLPIGREYRHSVFERFVFVGTKSRKYAKQVPNSDVSNAPGSYPSIFSEK
ncbi:MAG: LytTR family transcriptional regulator [Candidatus Symbiothrix sp.]|jgi:hypothetical protein|nr:LytTR family transcriptional regulator [Candidatus Symbiothrix sp.]